MTRHRRTIEEGQPQVPSYIVTFSDMTTLLLTFFVMLLSLSSVQDPELFNRGRGAFVESVRYLGLGMLQGARPRTHLGKTKPRYFILSPEDGVRTRIIDAKEEQIRRIFKKLTQSMAALPSQIVAKKTNFAVINIRFPPGQAILDEQARRFLTEFCAHLDDSYQAGLVRGGGQGDNAIGTLYVLGLATAQATEKQQWILSARRAQAVADFMRDILSANSHSNIGQDAGMGTDTRWNIYWWGAGPGGDWVGQESPISKQSHIMIAVLTMGD
jgi:chemotaxis protein MotB